MAEEQGRGSRLLGRVKARHTTHHSENHAASTVFAPLRSVPGDSESDKVVLEPVS